MRYVQIFSLLVVMMLMAFKLPPSGSEAYKSYFNWSEGRKLVWDDFQGKPIANAAEVAMTASSVEFSYTSKGNQLNWEVHAKFYPKLSWSTKKKQTDYILQHEQLHFDITELYARTMRKQLSAEVKSVKDIDKLKKIGDDILKQWHDEQEKYDRETKHSVDAISQYRWNETIQRRLDELADFASK